MAALALAGITGMYLRQVRQSRRPRPRRLPRVRRRLPHDVRHRGHRRRRPADLADTSPGFVNDVVAAAAGGTPTGDIGGLQTLFNLTGACYLLGGLLFGIALFRARVLARWAAVLLAVGTVGTAALAVLPDVFYRPLAVPEGIALIGLGVSLWRQPHRRPTRPVPIRRPPRTRSGRHPDPTARSPMTTPQGAGQPTFQPTSPGGRSTSPGTGGPRSTPAGALT